MKTKKTISNKNDNAAKAHALLAGYWVYRVITGAGVPKATLEVALVEGMSVLKERSGRQSGSPETSEADRNRSGAKVRKASVKAGVLANPMVRSGAKKLCKSVLRSQRVIR